MSIKNILLVVEDAPSGPARLDAAVALADQLSAHLAVLVIAPLPQLDLGYDGGFGGSFVVEEMQKAQEGARQEAEILITRARAEIQREHDEAISALRKEFAGLTILAAEKVIDHSLDKRTHRQLIDQVFEESSGLKKG